MVRVVLAAMALATVLPVPADWKPLAQAALNLSVFVLFLLYGMRIARRDVRAALTNVRFHLPLAAWVFLAMGVAGWLVSLGIAPFVPAALAVGFVFLGVLPSTVQSAAVYTSLAGGNVANSVVAAALLNVAGVILVVPLFALLAGGGQGALSLDTLVKVFAILLLPFAIGQLSRGRTRDWAARHRQGLSRYDKAVVAIGVYVAFSEAARQGIWRSLDLTSWAAVVAGCAVLLLFGYAGAWLASGALRLARADRKAFLFAGGQKSVALGAPLAAIIFTDNAGGAVLLPVVLYHFAQLVVAGPIAARLNSDPSPQEGGG